MTKIQKTHKEMLIEYENTLIELEAKRETVKWWEFFKKFKLDEDIKRYRNLSLMAWMLHMMSKRDRNEK